MPDFNVKETIDLKYFDRFDATTGAQQVRISTTGFFLSGPFQIGEKYALYLNKPGTILAIKQDPDGIAIKASGNCAKKILCPRLLQSMNARGTVPQSADLEWNEEAQAYIARLSTAAESAEESLRKRGGRSKA